MFKSLQSKLFQGSFINTAASLLEKQQNKTSNQILKKKVNKKRNKPNKTFSKKK